MLLLPLLHHSLLLPLLLHLLLPLLLQLPNHSHRHRPYRHCLQILVLRIEKFPVLMHLTLVRLPMAVLILIPSSHRGMLLNI